MQQFIDRRENPKDKSLGNRQRFLRRARAQIKQLVDRSVKERRIADIGKDGEMVIPAKGIREPRLSRDPRTGRHERVLPGNKDYVAGDRIAKPPPGGAGGRGKEGAEEGDGEDEFRFTLTRDEFLDVFFEDLELPDLVKTSLKDVATMRWERAGFARTGNPANLDVARTMRNSLGRRIALNRPRGARIDDINRRIDDLEAAGDEGCEDGSLGAIALLRERLADLKRRQTVIAYIDPVDVRYRQREPVPMPNTKAVMFCLMDVSGSMGEREKTLAKRFFVLLHLFLKRRYETIDVVFIRHTHVAQEVDEETFFYSPQTGGTKVSTALAEMQRVIKDRYPPEAWNIYAAQASDGENFSGDSEHCIALLQQAIMPLVQYYAYVEILDEREIGLFANPEAGAALWRAYREIGADWGNFAMKRISEPADIYPVFRELFAKPGLAA